jgi:hypothetical protein
VPLSHHEFRFVVSVGAGEAGEFVADTAAERGEAERQARELAFDLAGAEDVTVVEYYKGSHDGAGFEVVLFVPATAP